MKHFAVLLHLDRILHPVSGWHQNPNPPASASRALLGLQAYTTRPNPRYSLTATFTCRPSISFSIPKVGHIFYTALWIIWIVFIDNLTKPRSYVGKNESQLERLPRSDWPVGRFKRNCHVDWLLWKSPAHCECSWAGGPPCIRKLTEHKPERTNQYKASLYGSCACSLTDGLFLEI